MTERRRTRRAVNVARAARQALRRLLANAGDFVNRVYSKAGQDDIFFLAGGIAFNVLLGAVPFLLLIITLFTYVLQAAVDDPQGAAVEYVLQFLPPSQRVVGVTRWMVGQLLAGKQGVGILAFVLFIWTSTRMVGTLRTVLKDVFDLPEERPILAGKIFDLKMVLVAGTLFVANTAITVALEAARRYGVAFLGVEGRAGTQAFEAAWVRLLAFAFIFAMFAAIYRYLPRRRTPWRTTLIAATFTAVGWEVLKAGFAWYVRYVASYSMYGALVAPVILVFWVYYSAILFVLGGEVGHVAEVIWTRRKQRELLE
jgi:membrane protein